MSDLPRQVDIAEEGPREGFQIEKNPIPSADKIALIDALSATGLKHIQVASFVSPKLVPGWADAEAVVAGFTRNPDIHYTALWFNAAGLDRAMAFKDRLHLFGSISLAASEAFSLKNLNRDRAGQIEAMRKQTAAHIAAGVPVTRIGLQAAFGCNYAGDVAAAQVMAAIADGLKIAAEAGVAIRDLTLADTMGWANPHQIETVVGEVRNRWPELRLALHLHDTRGLGIAKRALMPPWVALAVAPLLASQARQAISRPRNWRCSVPSLALQPVLISKRWWKRAGLRNASWIGACQVPYCAAGLWHGFARARLEFLGRDDAMTRYFRKAKRW